MCSTQRSLDSFVKLARQMFLQTNFGLLPGSEYTWEFRVPGGEHTSSVVDPTLLFSDPDPALGLISDPDSDPDPACLTKVIRLFKIKL